MAKTIFKKTSPYYDTAQTTWYLSVLNYRHIPRDGTDRLRIIEGKYDIRPDLLSYDLYGTPDYWWVFMTMNPDAIKDPIYDFKSGMQIYVPTADRLSKLLGV